MKIFGKILWVCGFSLLVNVICFVCASAESRISSNTIVAWMFQHHLTKFDFVEDFGRDRPISRGEAAKFFTEFALLNGKQIKKSLVECEFRDIEGYDHTLKPYILQACQLGLMKGNGMQFFPEREINEVEGMTVIVRIIAGMQDESGEIWWQENLDIAKVLGWIENDTDPMIDMVASRGDISTWLYKAYNTNLDEHTLFNKDVGHYFIINSAYTCPAQLRSIDKEITKESCLEFNQDETRDKEGYRVWSWFEPGNKCITQDGGACGRRVLFLDEEVNSFGAVAGGNITETYIIKGENFFASHMKITSYVGRKPDGIISEDIIPINSDGSFMYEISKDKGNLALGDNVYSIEYSNSIVEQAKEDDGFKRWYEAEFRGKINSQLTYSWFDDLFITEVIDPVAIDGLPDFSLDKIVLSNQGGTIRATATLSNIGNVDYLIKPDEPIEVKCEMSYGGMGPTVVKVLRRNINRDHEGETMYAGGKSLEFIMDSDLDYETIDWDDISVFCSIYTPVKEVYTRNNNYQIR